MDITQKPTELAEVFTIAKADVYELAWANEKKQRATAMLALLQRDVADAERVGAEVTARIRSIVSEGGKYVMVGGVDIDTCSTRRVAVPVQAEIGEDKTA